MFSGGKNISIFFPPVYYTFFETKLVADSINNVTGKKGKEKRELLETKEEFTASYFLWRC